MKFAVIPSNGRDCLVDCVDAISPQVDQVIVIDTGNAQKVLAEHDPNIYRFLCETPSNISHWWNEGLQLAATFSSYGLADTWKVAILNDDAIVPPGWFDAVAAGMDARQAAAGCSGQHDVTLRQPGPVPLDMRMQGFAFILAGEKKLRANEDLHWYFTDDYIDWESRKLGGMTMVNGWPVEHRHPNGQLSPELAALIPRDAERFQALYGMRPW